MKDVPQYVRVVNLRSLVFWAVGIFLLLEFVDAIAVTILVFAVSFFLAIIIDPPIRRLDRRGFSRGISVAIIAVSMLATAALVAFLAVPPIVHEAGEMIEQAPKHAERLQKRAMDWTDRYPAIRDKIQEEDFGKRITQFGQGLLPRVGRFSLSILTGLLSILLILVITMYTLAQPEPLVRGAIRALPRDYRKSALRVLVNLSKQLQNWVRATFWMMLIVGLMCGLGLWALGVKSPLLFGVIAGIGEAIPTIGPILTAIPPFIVMLADDPSRAVWVLVLFLVVQQVENNLLVPRIMASTMNLHPVSVLFFVVAMSALMGPLGILFATPLCATVKVVYGEFYRRRVMAQAAAPEQPEV